MKYFLWIDEKQTGPYEADQIREMLREGRIAEAVLCLQEDGVGEWSPIGDFPEIINSPKPPEPVPHTQPTPIPVAKLAFSLPPIETPGVSIALTVFAVLDFIGGLIVGTADYRGNPGLGFLIFAGGVLSGFILLGFAAVIENTKESSQRLHRIEMLIQKSHDDKTTIDSATPKI